MRKREIEALEARENRLQLAIIGASERNRNNDDKHVPLNVVTDVATYTLSDREEMTGDMFCRIAGITVVDKFASIHVQSINDGNFDEFRLLPHEEMLVVPFESYKTTGQSYIDADTSFIVKLYTAKEVRELIKLLNSL